MHGQLRNITGAVARILRSRPNGSLEDTHSAFHRGKIIVVWVHRSKLGSRRTNHLERGQAGLDYELTWKGDATCAIASTSLVASSNALGLVMSSTMTYENLSPTAGITISHGRFDVGEMLTEFLQYFALRRGTNRTPHCEPSFKVIFDDLHRDKA